MNISLNPGIYTLVLSHQGYSNSVFGFIIRAGSISNLRANLRPLRQGQLNSGINGIIMYGPVKPVCQEGDTCVRVYRGNVIIKDLTNSRTIKSFFTDSKGKFSVNLKPGNYTLKVNRKFITPCQQNFEVFNEVYTSINLTCDTGIR